MANWRECVKRIPSREGGNGHDRLENWSPILVDAVSLASRVVEQVSESLGPKTELEVGDRHGGVWVKLSIDARQGWWTFDGSLLELLSFN